MDGAACAVDDDYLPVAQPGGGYCDGDNGRDAVFTGDERGVGGYGAAVGYYGREAGEEGRPGWCGGRGDEHVAGQDSAEVVRPIDDADGPGGPPAAGWLAGKDVVVASVMPLAHPQGIGC